MSTHQGDFLHHIHKLNSWNPAHFKPFFMCGQQVGYLKDFMCRALNRWPEYFLLDEQGVKFSVTSGMMERSRILDEVVQQLVEQDVIAHYLGETYPVTATTRDHPLASIDRGSVSYFGIRAYGQHTNGYVSTGNGLAMWIARRAADRINFPGKLDNLVAGGLPQNISLQDNLQKECREEAGIPAELVSKAHATGAISYCCEIESGLKPDTLFCYDLELPASFSPNNTDGEVAEFQLLALDSVIQLLHNGDEFKPNCNLVVLDFLIRHGAIGPENPDYLELISGLHT